MIDFAGRDGIPAMATIYRWQELHPEFAEAFSRARFISAHVMAEMAVRDAKGATAEDAHAQRVKYDAQKWMASKLNPRAYGDKLLHTGGDGEGPIETKLTRDYGLLDVEQLMTLRKLIEAATPRKDEPATIEGDAEETEDGE